MEFNWDRYYGIVKRLATLTGQWPYQNKRERVFRLSVMMMATLIINVPQVCKFINCNKNLECILQTVSSYLLVLLVMLKLYISTWNTDKIKFLTDRVFVDWERLQNPKEYEIMMSYVTSARWIVRMYFAVCQMGVTTFVLVSLIPRIMDVMLPLNESRPVVLPYEAYYFVDEREYFSYIFFHALIVSQIVILGLVAYDTLFMTFIEHVCGVFAVAGFRFKHLVCEDVNIMKIINNDRDDTYNKRMACCVKVHWAALEFAEHLENTFCLSFGAELLLITIVLSVTLFQVTLQLSDTIEAMRYAIYVIAQLIHLFIFSWEGQRLIDHSLEIHDKIYSCSWYKIPAKSQRLILNVLKRSLRPKSFSAGNMFIFSLQGFTTVVQTSMSYFTVLSSV